MPPLWFCFGWSPIPQPPLSWATTGMMPIVFGAGVLLGMLAYASRTLVFCMIGHTITDIGLFAYWWTQIAGTFSQKSISVSGVDQGSLSNAWCSRSLWRLRCSQLPDCERQLQESRNG
jgi:hypothetical protein